MKFIFSGESRKIIKQGTSFWNRIGIYNFFFTYALNLIGILNWENSSWISVLDLISRASCYTLFYKIYATGCASLKQHFHFYFTFLAIIPSNLNSAKADGHVIFHILQRLKQYFTGFTGEIKVFPSFFISQRTCRNWPYLEVGNIYCAFCRVYKKFYSLFIVKDTTLVHF